MHYSRLKIFLLFQVFVCLTAEDCSLEDASNLTPECISNIAKTLWNPLQRNASFRSTALKINQLMNGPVGVFRRAQVSSNSTDEILDQFDKSIIDTSRNVHYELVEQANLVVLMFNVRITPIAGIAIYTGTRGELINRQIYRNSTLVDVVAQGDLLVSAYLPPVLLNQIDEAVANPMVTITVFFKDTLFSEAEVKYKTSGIVFGVLIPGFNEEFRAPIKLAYQVNEDDDELKGCAHWLYGYRMKGKWQQDDRTSVCGSLEICEYYHATHFGMLVLNSTDSIKEHEHALDVITLIGCCLSIVGVFGVFLTGILFPKWRQNKGNIILMNQALATLLEIICLYVSDYVKESVVCNDTWCFWSGIILHYIVLAQFFWVLVISYLQYKRYVQILGAPTNRLILKTCLIGWCGPLPVVITLGAFFGGSYKRGQADLCYPTGIVLFVGVLLPILLIVLTNIAVFLMIMTSVFWKNIDVPRLADNVNILRMRLVVLLFFQLGISWIFGFLSNLGIFFIYVFCITATTQGFVVFLLFIVFNGAANQHYKKLFGIGKKKTQKQTTTETSTSTRLTQ